MLRSYACRLRCTIPLQSFCRCCFVPRCFFLSTDTDVGGSKQKRVLLSKTCYQTCTRMYRFDSRSKKPHNFTIVHGWTWFYAVTSLTFRQTRVQALYMDVQRLIEDFCFNRCPKHYRPSFCLFLTYGRNSFCEKESVEFFLFLILL